MSKNVVIFSDGTGQRGGLLFDERRSNIYKLYRASRCGPDSTVDPSRQLAFYDPGIGTLPAGVGFFGAVWHKIRNLVSQATGLGLTKNIIDCYAALIELWEPGDRIFLFGFSRGAYTVRCLSGVLALCGVPTKMPEGRPLLRDEKTAERIAREAVKRVYQHTSSWSKKDATPRQRKLLDQRRALGRRFRRRYSSGDDEGPNVYPHFIGVFDTVASLSNPVAVVGFLVAAVVVIVAASAFLSWFVLSFWTWSGILLAVAAVVSLIAYLASHVKVAFGLDGYSWRETFHFTEMRMQFYDRELNPNVGYARHALSIDEKRAAFPRVGWGSPSECRMTEPGGPEWFKQLWFAGDHSDVGGSYPENESRLSDISLKWMSDEARSVGLLIDESVLHLYPSPAGMQHDERKSSWIFRQAGKLVRDPPVDAPLHESVLERLELRAVLQYDEMKPYRPECLRGHEGMERYYKTR